MRDLVVRGTAVVSGRDGVNWGPLLGMAQMAHGSTKVLEQRKVLFTLSKEGKLGLPA